MASITKLLNKLKVLEWIVKYQTIFEDIKNWYIQAFKLINPNRELEFHVHNYASQLAIFSYWVLGNIGLEPNR
jgi:hypothetical protein